MDWIKPGRRLWKFALISSLIKKEERLRRNFRLYRDLDIRLKKATSCRDLVRFETQDSRLLGFCRSNPQAISGKLILDGAFKLRELGRQAHPKAAVTLIGLGWPFD
jgi:hypothetical protein